MDDARTQAITRFTITGDIGCWAYGTGQRAKRVIDAGHNVDDETDVHFFAIALRNLRIAVEWGRNLYNVLKDGTRGRALANALRDSDAGAPGVRDLETHFVEYERGAKPRKFKHVRPPPAILWETSSETTVVHVGSSTA